MYWAQGENLEYSIKGISFTMFLSLTFCLSLHHFAPIPPTITTILYAVDSCDV